MHYLHFHEQLGKSRTISHYYSRSHNYFILLSLHSIFTISFVSLKIIMLPNYMHESNFCHKAKVLVLREGLKKLFSWNSWQISYVANWYMYKHYSLVLYCFQSIIHDWKKKFCTSNIKGKRQMVKLLLNFLWLCELYICIQRQVIEWELSQFSGQ